MKRAIPNDILDERENERVVKKDATDFAEDMNERMSEAEINQRAHNSEMVLDKMPKTKIKRKGQAPDRLYMLP